MKILFKGILLVTMLMLICCDIPRDNEDTLSRARSNGIEVGVIENPPFASQSGNVYTGDEIQLIREFGRSNGMEVHFRSGNETRLVDALKKHEIHVILGGIEKKTNWKKEVTTTTTYDKKHVFLIPKGENGWLYELDQFLIQKREQ